MSGIQRFVTYLYLYEGNEKIRNTGFAKVEIRGDQCRLEIHIKSAGLVSTASPIYLFSREDQIMHAIEIGRMNLQDGNGDYKALLKSVEIGHSPYGMRDMKGIVILVNNQNMFASQWDDGSILRENIQVWEPKLTLPSIPDAEPVTIKATEMPMRKFQKEVLRPQESLLDAYLRLQKKIEDVDILQSEKGQNCGIHIELRDIRELPKRYWYLGNNSFLLHGFFNYRYLFLGKRMVDGTETIFLGVPGVYSSQECVMAALFGFPEFLPENQVQFEQSKQENEQEQEAFGYWCHIMPE